MIDEIKFIAAYQTDPVRAITHYAAVDRIDHTERMASTTWSSREKAKPIGPIPFADARTGSMQGPRYTTLDKLKAAKKLSDVIDKS